MKFLKIRQIILAMPAILAAFILPACSTENDLAGNVSRLRDDTYYGESESYTLYAYPEVCESPMIADGSINPTKKVVILKLKVKSGEDGEYSVSFTTDKTYTETFSFSAFQDSYVSHITVEKLPDEPFIATICYSDKSEEINMTSLLKESTISADEALESAYSAKKEYVDGYMENGVFNGEIYIRLIADGEKNYWYVGFITENETLCLLLDESGTVLEERTINNP